MAKRRTARTKKTPAQTEQNVRAAAAKQDAAIAGFRRRTRSTAQVASEAADRIPYTPEEWTPAQLQAHRATTMDGAFHAASCLAAGWYRRPVTIDYQVTKDNDERYMVRPSEVPALAGWSPCYEVKAVSRDL